MMLGKANSRLKNKEKAKEWLNRALDYPGKKFDDVEVRILTALYFSMFLCTSVLNLCVFIICVCVCVDHARAKITRGAKLYSSGS